MKNHNMALCSRVGHPINTCYQGSVSSSSSSSPTATELDIAEILLQLQDEFHQMSLYVSQGIGGGEWGKGGVVLVAVALIH